MARPKSVRPTDGELEILSIMWPLGDSTVRDVHDVMVKQRDVAQSTVDKRMRAMVQKKLLQIVDERRPTRFRVAMDQKRTYESMFKDLVRRMGSPANMVMHLLRGSKITASERKKVQEQLDKME